MFARACLFLVFAVSLRAEPAEQARRFIAAARAQIGVTVLYDPQIIHNIGAGTRMEDRLFDFEITGH